jgi:hypothetical protein
MRCVILSRPISSLPSPASADTAQQDTASRVLVAIARSVCVAVGLQSACELQHMIAYLVLTMVAHWTITYWARAQVHNAQRMWMDVF